MKTFREKWHEPPASKSNGSVFQSLSCLNSLSHLLRSPGYFFLPWLPGHYCFYLPDIPPRLLCESPFPCLCRRLECSTALPTASSLFIPQTSSHASDFTQSRVCRKDLIQQVWDLQTLHIPKEGLALACLLEDHL